MGVIIDALVEVAAGSLCLLSFAIGVLLLSVAWERMREPASIRRYHAQRDAMGRLRRGH